MIDTPPPSPVQALFVMLAVRGASEAIAFYSNVFDARESFRLTGSDGRISHAELQLGPATLMLADEQPDWGFVSPLAFGGTGMMIHLHVGDVDAIVGRVVAAGGTVLREPADEGHGERQAKIRDPFGHEWLLGHALESVSDEEIQRRFAASASGQ